MDQIVLDSLLLLYPHWFSDWEKDFIIKVRKKNLFKLPIFNDVATKNGRDIGFVRKWNRKSYVAITEYYKKKY